MRQDRLDLWLGLALLVVALGWSWIVVTTIPAAEQLGAAGPRAFPLLLGLILGALGVIMAGMAALRLGAGNARGEIIAAVSRREARIVVSGFVLLMGYAFLLDKVGFLLATPIVVILAIRAVLGIRAWITNIAIAAGLTLGSFLVFVELMEANLPRGTWIQIY